MMTYQADELMEAFENEREYHGGATLTILAMSTSRPACTCCQPHTRLHGAYMTPERALEAMAGRSFADTEFAITTLTA